MKKYYTGIGSRESPPEICAIMTRLAEKLETMGFRLRSGGADGCDKAFAQGVEKEADIYIPFRNFDLNGQLTKIWHNYIVVDESDQEALDSLRFHPAPDKLTLAARKMMMRNWRQIVGKDGAPNSKFVVMWTEGGEKKGGTSQVWRIADSLSIPVFNLAREEDLKRINQFLI